MKETKKAPKRGKAKRLYKGTIRSRILQHLLAGKHNAQELSVLTGACDPRGHIRDLRDNGIPVADYWEYNGDRKYKVYFIHKEEHKN